MIRWLAAFLLVPVLASAQEAFQLPSGNIHCAVFDGLLASFRSNGSTA